MTPPEIRHARIVLGMSQSRLGAALGVSGRTVRAWEQGENQPHPNNVAALRRLLKRHAAAQTARAAAPRSLNRRELARSISLPPGKAASARCLHHQALT